MTDDYIFIEAFLDDEWWFQIMFTWPVLPCGDDNDDYYDYYVCLEVFLDDEW